MGLETLEQQQQELAQKIALQKDKREAAVIEQIVEPLVDAVEELNDTLRAIKNIKPEGEKQMDGFKDMGNNLLISIEKVFGLLQKLQPQKLDLSPITSIATEIKSQNTSLLNLVSTLSNESNKAGYEGLVKEVMAMVQRSNDFISKGLQQVDYSKEFSALTAVIEKNKKPTKWEFEIERNDKYGKNQISKVIAIAKT